MSPEEIARAFVACPGWAWLPGMCARCLLIGDALGLILDDADHHGMVLMCDADPETRISTRDRLTPEGYAPDLDPQTLAIIAHVLLPSRWPGHSVQVEMFPDGTARVAVFASATSSSNNTGYAVFRISHEPVAVALLRCLEASP